MHTEAYNGFARMLSETGLNTQDEWLIFDFGGRDINGSVRDQLPNATWKGIDISPGPGVDLVQDLTQPWGHRELADIVVSTELLEHVQDWRSVLRTASEAIDPSGVQFLFLTCASNGRPEHGASGEPLPPPGEWYGNVDPNELREELKKYFSTVRVVFNPNPGDAYAWAAGIKVQGELA